MSIVPASVPIVEGKVYKSKRNKNKDTNDEDSALKELQQILSAKNRRMCPCEAQVHELVSNCLGCGRVICQSEGPGKCLTCGNLVLNKDQRSRLQQYISLMPDTSHVKAAGTSPQRRVRVIDNHFDYFAIGDQNWISPADRQSLKIQVDELQDAKYKRKLMLNVDLDSMVASAESVPQVEDFYEQVRQLQIKSDSNLGETLANCTLNELVSQESGRQIKFTYVTKDMRIGSKEADIEPKKAQPAKHESAQHQKKNDKKRPKGTVKSFQGKKSNEKKS